MRSFRAIASRVARYEAALGWLAIGVALLALDGSTLLEHMRTSADPWAFADDARVLIQPQFRLEDPTLFRGDPACDYMLASLPDGYALVYRLLAPLVGVVALSKVLPYVLLAITAACVGRTVWRLAGPSAVLGALILLLGAEYPLGRMVGGLPRGFALPLLAAGTLALVEGRVVALASLTVVAAGFYPVVSMTLGVVLALWLALPARSRGKASSWSWQRRVAVVGATAVAAVLVLVPVAWRLKEWGAPIGPSLVHLYPEAGPLGRFDALDRAPFPPLPRAALAPIRWALVGAGAPVFPWLDARAEGAWLAPLCFVLGLAGCGWLAWRRPEARRFLLLPLAVALCHTASLWVVPALFLPERHLAYAVPLVALVAVPCALAALTTSRRRSVRALPLAANLLVIGLLGARGVSWAGLTVRVPPEAQALDRALARLPKQAVIAAFPSETTDSVPYVTRRTMFLTRETHMPFHAGYTELMRGRALALFHAYFASSEQALREFRDRYGVTHLLIDRRNFAQRPQYFAPFDATIARDFAHGKEHGFAALALAPALGVIQRGPIVVLDLRRL